MLKSRKGILLIGQVTLIVVMLGMRRFPEGVVLSVIGGLALLIGSAIVFVAQVVSNHQVTPRR